MIFWLSLKQFVKLKKVDTLLTAFYSQYVVPKLVIHSSLTIDYNLKLQRLLESIAIVGQSFCFVRDLDSTC